MIKTSTLKALESIVGFDEMVKAIGMQAILHTTQVTEELIGGGAFHREICARFASLLGEDSDSAERALSAVLACEEYDRRVSFEGLGGCEVVPLEALLKSRDIKPVVQDVATAPRVLVVVSGGIADPVSDVGVDVEVFDWDNYKDDPKGTGGVPDHFADLAGPIGVPVGESPVSKNHPRP